MPPELRAARRELARVRALLINPGPENLSQCTPLLEKVIAGLDEFAQGEADGRGGNALRVELLSVRREAGWALALFEQAGRYYQTVDGLLKLAAAPVAACSYQAGGALATQAGASCPQLVLHG